MVRGEVKPIHRSYPPNTVVHRYQLIGTDPVFNEGIAQLNRFDGAGATIATGARQVTVLPPCSRSLIQVHLLMAHWLDI